MLLLVIAGVWLAAAIHGVLAVNSAIIAGLDASGAYFAGTIGAILALCALHWIFGSETVAVGQGVVSVTRRSLRGRQEWREPLANYREIRSRREDRPHRYGERWWYVVELWHPEGAKVVELARTKSPGSIEARAQEWAKRFGLPRTGPRDQPAARPDTGGAKLGPRLARHSSA